MTSISADQRWASFFVGKQAHPLLSPNDEFADYEISTTNLSRINRRMHTKSFTVDNQVTIHGGRNIADEYFGAREDAKFGDLDVVGIGSIAKGVSRMFDSYWNHETALPVSAAVTP